MVVHICNHSYMQAETGGSQSEATLCKIKTICKKQTKTKMTRGMAQAVGQFPHKCKALSSKSQYFPQKIKTRKGWLKRSWS